MTRCTLGMRCVDFLDAVDAQHLAGGLLGELVGAVGGADGDGQGVHVGLLDEVGGFVGVGQQGGMVQHAFGAVAVFLAGLAGFQGTQAAQFAFHGHAAGMGQFHHVAGGVHVVFIGGGGLAVGAQGAVHHHGAEAGLDGAEADAGGGAVVLVHAHGDVRVGLDGGQDQVAQEGLAGIGTGAGGTLQDHRAVGLVGGLHDGLDLFHVVDVEGGQAVAVFGGVVEQLTQGNQSHLEISFRVIVIRLSCVRRRERSSWCWCRRACRWARRW
jgi:hypothetical protein